MLKTPLQTCNGKRKIEKATVSVQQSRDILEQFGILIAVGAGDFNSRTGDRLDYIKDDSLDINNFAQTNLLPDEYKIDNCFNRYSCDKVVNGQGINLLDLSTSSSLRILNGRYIGDIMGNFTCMTSNGSSVVDYAIVTFLLICENEISKFNLTACACKMNNCSMCPFFCHSRDELIQYLVRRHRNAPNLIVHCSAPGCGASFANLVSFRVHCFRKHFRDEEPTNLSDDELDIDFETNNDTELAQNDSNLARKSAMLNIFLSLNHNIT
ncbi:unnamed protein product [Mytilus edulis]|uniref:C2H2-type domain-containing protein n=1 Tax=Mytilus edulis TaxID=6550 RepID=A0A8S3SNB3_MYTED|nr:unnamed protein product [Mytilus edulis]